MQWIYAITAATFFVGGATVFALFLGTVAGIVVGTALIAVGVAFVIFAVF